MGKIRTAIHKNNLEELISEVEENISISEVDK